MGKSQNFNVSVSFIQTYQKPLLTLTTVQRRWGKDYTLVTNDGLEPLDSPGTRGKNLNKSAT